MSFQGVSFKYPSYWKSETEKLEEGHYFIKCYERFNTGTMLLVSYYEGEQPPAVILKNFLDTYNEDIKDASTKSSNVITKSTGPARYGNHDCMVIQYEVSVIMAKSYGNAYAFNADGKSFLIVEQSERHYDLKHDKFKLMRDSFTLGTPADSTEK